MDPARELTSRSALFAPEMRHLKDAEHVERMEALSETPHYGFDRLKVVLLVVWAAASFGVSWFARDLRQVVAGWPVNFWFVAQGAVLVFLGIVVVYATIRNRQERAHVGAGAADENA